MGRNADYDEHEYDASMGDESIAKVEGHTTSTVTAAEERRAGCPDRQIIVGTLMAQLQLMREHVAATADGRAGQGLAFYAPDKYRSLLEDLAKHDGTNGHEGSCDRCRES